MSQKVREEMLPRMRQRYAGRGKEGRGALLDEVCEQFGYSRKHAIKLLGAKVGWGGDPVVRKGRPAVYGEEVERVVHRMWKAAEQPCGKRLAELRGLWLARLRAAIWEAGRGNAPEGAFDQRGADRPAAGSAQGAGRQGALRNEARRAAQDADPDTHGQLGCGSAGIFGGRHGGALREQTGGGFCVERDLHGHRQRMDGQPCGVEQGGRRDRGGHARGGGGAAV